MCCSHSNFFFNIFLFFDCQRSFNSIKLQFCTKKHWKVSGGALENVLTLFWNVHTRWKLPSCTHNQIEKQALGPTWHDGHGRLIKQVKFFCPSESLSSRFHGSQSSGSGRWVVLEASVVALLGKTCRSQHLVLSLCSCEANNVSTVELHP